ncbi:beta-glucosidase BglX [Bacteroides coprosuis]|uniref:beta-glucosidase BglX n=1 Tax=Bacteroides coprosuis TaxID=151276 RepID=UPI001D395AA2|nr:beta-glucosidase BglX [Bacteroides coprosuis]HJD92117.1 beta-glucosidase BglX [Bacteroides coprosuis]
MKLKRLLGTLCIVGISSITMGQQKTVDQKVNDLLSRMTLKEKIGQMNQNSYFGLSDADIDKMPDLGLDENLRNIKVSEAQIAKMSRKDKIQYLKKQVLSGLDQSILQPIRKGEVGSLLNVVDPEMVNLIQKTAIKESRLGIPLLIARDVIHGYKTIFPIPLGQAASFNPEVVEVGAQVAAREARSVGIHWTFAPMMDISRDARWGRVAESLGEDPYLAAELGLAMVKGFQDGGNLKSNQSVAACVKHFVGYGAAEGGRDYNSTNIPPALMRNVYLAPFEKSIKGGAATLMTSFNDNDGIPASANKFLLKDVLRDEWGFKGVVVSDWASIAEMIPHGFAKDGEQAAELSANALLDIDMVSHTYHNHLEKLVDEGKVSMETIDAMVRNILRLKYDMGLFDNPYIDTKQKTPFYAPQHLEAAQKAAVESAILLKNEGVLPLNINTKIAVVGPLADAPHDQMGTWVFDGEKEHTVTPLKALQTTHKNIDYVYEAGLKYSRDTNTSQFDAVKQAVEKADVAVVFVGEEAILSGEAHSLSDINLIGKQSDLIREVKSVGKPVVVVIMAGRPLTIERDLAYSDAVLYNFHPGTMGGPAILDLLFGKENPSGKLPMTFVREVGQIPMYYNHNNTGRPAPEKVMTLADIELEAGQTSLGNTSFYLDSGRDPLFPFGFGLSYSTFEYSNLNLSAQTLTTNDILKVTVDLKNTSNYAGTEVAQLYVRDLFGSIVRPVRELKGFQRVTLQPGETKSVVFELPISELAFYGQDGTNKVESGEFKLWVGTNSNADLESSFQVK